MKNLIQIKVKSLLLTFVVITSLYSKLNAQIPGTGPFTIVNSTTCTIEIRWNVIDGTCLSACLGTIGTVTIPPSGIINITSGMIIPPCGSACDVLVVFVGLSGNNFASPYFISVTGGSGISSAEPDCSGGSYVYSWTVSSTSIVIS